MDFIMTNHTVKQTSDN